MINRYELSMASICMYVIVRSRDNVATCFVIVAIHVYVNSLDLPHFAKIDITKASGAET